MYATETRREDNSIFLPFSFLAAPKAAGAPARPAKKVEEEEDDDDFDMFGSDDEVDEEAERIKVKTHFRMLFAWMD